MTQSTAMQQAVAMMVFPRSSLVLWLDAVLKVSTGRSFLVSASCSACECPLQQRTRPGWVFGDIFDWWNGSETWASERQRSVRCRKAERTISNDQVTSLAVLQTASAMYIALPDIVLFLSHEPASKEGSWASQATSSAPPASHILKPSARKWQQDHTRSGMAALSRAREGGCSRLRQGHPDVHSKVSNLSADSSPNDWRRDRYGRYGPWEYCVVEEL